MAFNHRDLAVLDAAQRVDDDVNQVLDHTPRLIHRGQLRRSAHAISSNISEGFGRGAGGDRKRSLGVARGEAEETINHLRVNFTAKRIGEKVYWPLRNRLVVIVKMLTALMER